MLWTLCYAVAVLALALSVVRVVQAYSTLPGVHRRPVLVTGCDSGFGRQLAGYLDAKGVPVYAGCLFENSLHELRRTCSSLLKPIKLDVTDSVNVRDAAEFVAKDLGEKALWAIVNNAGITGPIVPFEWTAKEDCRRTLEVNLLGTYDVILAFLPLLRRGKEGRIVNMASAMGRITFAASTYAVSKFAVEGLSDGLNYELAPWNITTHVLEPGLFRTPLIDFRRHEKLMPNFIAKVRPDIKNLYGGEEYIDKLLRFNTELAPASTKTHLVVHAYEHALFARYPQTRYQVGLDAKLLWIPFSLLPLGIQMMGYKCFCRFGKGPPRPRGAFN